jgi:prepilin-type N-terminal cleavage/methylation domain-containing protein
MKLYPRNKPALGKDNDSGFALLEVLVSILIIALYVGLGFQGFVISTMFKVKAERDAQIAQALDADVAVLRSQAGSLSLAGSPPALDVSTSTKLTAMRSRCQATVAANGFANLLQANAGSNTSTRLIYGRNFQFVRSFTIADARPQILQVTYVVTDTDANEEVGRLQTEIIPDAFTYCGAIS